MIASILFSFMNRLPLEIRVQILTMLCEGSSMRSVSRVAGVSINTVTKLLVDAGLASVALHEDRVREVTSTKRLQCDEIWAFCFAKKRNASQEMKRRWHGGRYLDLDRLRPGLETDGFVVRG